MKIILNIFCGCFLTLKLYAVESNLSPLSSLQTQLTQINSFSIDYNLDIELAEPLVKEFSPERTKINRKVFLSSSDEMFFCKIDDLSKKTYREVSFDGNYYASFSSNNSAVFVSKKVPMSIPELLGGDGFFEPFAFVSLQDDTNLGYFMTPSRIFGPKATFISKVETSAWTTKQEQGREYFYATVITNKTYLKRAFDYRISLDKNRGFYPSLTERIDKLGKIITRTLSSNFKEYKIGDNKIIALPSLIITTMWDAEGQLLRTITWTVVDLKINKNVNEDLFTFDLSRAKIVTDLDTKIVIPVPK